MDIQLKKGLLDYCVLKSLSTEPSYGYKIINDVNKYIEVSESTLYPILKRLEENKYLETYKEEHNGRLRKYYKISDSGLLRLKEFKNEWKKIDKAVKYIMKGIKDE